jgi:hypothetical protein
MGVGMPAHTGKYGVLSPFHAGGGRSADGRYRHRGDQQRTDKANCRRSAVNSILITASSASAADPQSCNSDRQHKVDGARSSTYS